MGVRQTFTQASELMRLGTLLSANMDLAERTNKLIQDSADSDDIDIDVEHRKFVAAQRHIDNLREEIITKVLHMVEES